MKPVSDPASGSLGIEHDPERPPLCHVRGVDDMPSVVAWLRAHKSALYAELRTAGAVLLRGLPVRCAEDFATVRDELIMRRAAYQEKATPRSDYGEGVYSSTDLPAAQPIQLHNENSYTLEFPGILLFCCMVAPEQGGATTLGDVRRVLTGIPAGLRERFRATGWLLQRCYGEFMSMPWSRAFGLSDRTDVGRYCDEHLIGYEWRPGDRLRTVQRRPAIILHPSTGEEVWFNHVAFWSRWSLESEIREVLVDTYGSDSLPFDTFFGDGTPLRREDVEALNRAYASATVREPWRPGDVLIVDNILFAHGRDSFKGDRKILVAMGDPVNVRDCAPGVEPAASPAPVPPAVMTAGGQGGVNRVVG